MLDLVMGYDCNATCDYCTITPAMRVRACTTEALDRALVAYGARPSAATSDKTVQFGGGEPTLRPDLLRLVRRARALGYTTIKVQTNGFRFAHAPYVAALVSAGMNATSLSLMSHDPDAYERITGFPRALDLVVAGLENLATHPTVAVAADVIMKRDTFSGLATLVSEFAPRGVRTFTLWLVSLSDRNAAFPESLPRVSEMFPAIAAACARGRELGVGVFSRHIPACMLPGLEAHLCDTRTEDVTVVTPDETLALRDSRISANRFGARCGGCARRARCAGIRSDYLDRHGDAELVPF